MEFEELGNFLARVSSSNADFGAPHGKGNKGEFWYIGSIQKSIFLSKQDSKDPIPKVPQAIQMNTEYL